MAELARKIDRRATIRLLPRFFNRLMKQYKLRKVSVGTVKKSMAAICFA